MAKYRGPCLDCGEYKDQQYTHKRCIACYQKFHRYNPEFQVREKYTGPCVNCGSMNSTTGRFIRKMCGKCYSRFRETGNPALKERNKYPGPCVICGSETPGYAKYFQEKMCGKCYRHYIFKRDHPNPGSRYCIDCGKPLKKYGKRERCDSCHNKFKRRTDNIFYTKERQRLTKYRKTERGREMERNHVRKRRAILAKVENTLTAQEWREVLSQYDYKCAYCGSTKKIEMDHIIPVSKGGPHIKSNVIPACRKCNNKKGDRQVLKPIQPILI